MHLIALRLRPARPWPEAANRQPFDPSDDIPFWAMGAFSGDVLVTIPTGASFRQRFKHPYIIIHRIDLHHALLDACRRTHFSRGMASMPKG